MKRQVAEAAEEAEAVAARTTGCATTWHAFVCVDPATSMRVRAYYVDERRSRATPLLVDALHAARAVSPEAERALMAAVTRLLDDVTSASRATDGYTTRAAQAQCGTQPTLCGWLRVVSEPDHAGRIELEAWRVARHGRLPNNRTYHVHSFEL